MNERRWRLWRTVLRLLALVPLALAAPAKAQPDDLQQLRARALELVNEARKAEGLNSLQLGQDLNAAAQFHARDMLRRSYYAHKSPEGKTVADRYQAQGGSRWRLTAENIARCKGCGRPSIARVERLHEGWMNSPEHRENILREGLTRFGFGIAGGGDRPLYAVQTFAGPGTPRGTARAEDDAEIGASEAAKAALAIVNEARRKKGVQPLQASGVLDKAAAALASGRDDMKLADDALFEALPEEARSQWRALSALMARCGGCGARRSRADVRNFAQQWLDGGGASLLDARFAHMGFALAANGEGRKTAIALLGQGR